MESGLVTSSARTSTVTPAASAAERSAPALPGSRMVATVLHPACAAATAVARPMPVDVPVIRMVRSAASLMGSDVVMVAPW